MWQELCDNRVAVVGGASDGDDSGRAVAATASCRRAECSSPRVLACVSDAVDLVAHELEVDRTAGVGAGAGAAASSGGTNARGCERADVLVTGSLHLVGAALSVLAQPGSADSPVRP